MKTDARFTFAEKVEFGLHVRLELVDDSLDHVLQGVVLHHRQVFLQQRNVGQTPDRVVLLQGIDVWRIHLWADSGLSSKQVCSSYFCPRRRPQTYGLQGLVHGGSQLSHLVKFFRGHLSLSDGFASDVVHQPDTVGLNTVSTVCRGQKHTQKSRLITLELSQTLEEGP